MLAGSPRANDLWGVGGLCQPAKMCVVVRRCRAFAAGTRPARAAVRRALLTFVLALLLAGALAATADAQATVTDPTPVTDPVTTTPTVTDPTPVTDPT